MDLGKSIKIIRKEGGFKQNEFCELVGITQSYLSSIENNKKKPSIEVLEKITNALNIPLALLFWFTLTEDDITESKKESYRLIKPSIDGLLNAFFN
jgi:transcriptional regulator with XRE-family HTH domain